MNYLHMEQACSYLMCYQVNGGSSKNATVGMYSEYVLISTANNRNDQSKTRSIRQGKRNKHDTFLSLFNLEQQV